MHFTMSLWHELDTIFLVLLQMIILAIIANLKVIYSSIQIACLFWNCLFLVTYLHSEVEENQGRQIRLNKPDGTN